MTNREQCTPEAVRRNQIKQAITELRAFGRRHRLNGLSIREMIDEGRRYEQLCAPVTSQKK